MKRHRIAVIDLAARGPARSLHEWFLNPNIANIMPQAVAVWCEQAGHDVEYFAYTGSEKLPDVLPSEPELVLIGAFTQSAYLAYALSNLYRQRGAVTVLGGPHARCYPQDACQYFDYVVGLTDRALIEEVLRDFHPHRPQGVYLTADQHTRFLPGLRERWKYVEANLQKGRLGFKAITIVGSLGCPYTCEFCIDATAEYQPLDYDQIRDDLRFVTEKRPGALVFWQDANFGVRFGDYMAVIEEAIPPGSLKFLAESSLSLLTEPNLRQLKAMGFVAMAPAVESWYAFGNKARTTSLTGPEKMASVTEHVQLIHGYIPYLQINLVLGLDYDEGAEPFELSKQFVDQVPWAFPAFAYLTAFGQAAPMNLGLQQAGRVVPIPFHLLNVLDAMNVKPKHYTWREFYDRSIDLLEHAYSRKAFLRRAWTSGVPSVAVSNTIRGYREGTMRIRNDMRVRKLLDDDPAFASFMEGETNNVPPFYADDVERDLGPLWDVLPEGALQHDPNAWLKEVGNKVVNRAIPA